MNKLFEFLQEDNGGFSATRLGFLLWVVGVLVVWMITSLKNMALAPIDSSVATVIGILMTGKVVQKFGEKPNGQPGSTTSVAPASTSAAPAAPAAPGKVV